MNRVLIMHDDDHDHDHCDNHDDDDDHVCDEYLSFDDDDLDILGVCLPVGQCLSFCTKNRDFRVSHGVVLGERVGKWGL